MNQRSLAYKSAMRPDLANLLLLTAMALATSEAFLMVSNSSRKASEAFRDRILEHLKKQGESVDNTMSLKEMLKVYQLSYEYSNLDILRSLEVNAPDSDLGDIRMQLLAETQETRRLKTVQVQVDEGVLRGRRIRSEKNGFEYYAFLGVPYAEKPQRFQAPVPVKPWKGIKDATMEGPACWQVFRFLERAIGSEDCLYANINTPTLEKKRLPVFVWVHGGAFTFGSGSSIQNHPTRLLKNNVVQASFNYRIGALGFLSSGTKDAPGNAGMKDVVQFLRWLKKNVKHFGGDPDNITLYGVSSAGSVVEYLMLSPMARGLFHKAIIHSGTSQSFWAFNDNPLKHVFQLAKHLGTDTSDIEQVMKKLKEANAKDIVEMEIKMNMNESPLGDYLIFVPSPEDDFPGVEPFIQERPEIIMKSGNYTQVPVMYGINSDEGIVYLDTLKELKNIMHLQEYFLPSSAFSKCVSMKARKKVLETVDRFYFNKEYSDRKLSTLAGDFRFVLGIYLSIKNNLQSQKYPTYVYEFSYDGAMSALRPSPKVNPLQGVGHADDLFYVLDQLFYPITNMDYLTEAVADRQAFLYTNFAKYGNPTLPSSGLTPWIPISSLEKFEYMKISAYLEMKTNLFKERRKFWEDLLQNKYCSK